jgi:hypothetical protein
LGTLCDSGRKLQLLQWMHGSQEHPNASAPPLGARINSRAERLPNPVGRDARVAAGQPRDSAGVDDVATETILVDAIGRPPDMGAVPPAQSQSHLPWPTATVSRYSRTVFGAEILDDGFEAETVFAPTQRLVRTNP